MPAGLRSRWTALGEEIYKEAGHRFNINSPKQLGDVLFNKMNLPKPLKYGKGKVVSTAQDVLEELAAHHEVPALVLEYRQLAKLKSNYVDSLPLLADTEGRVHTTFNQVGTATGRLSSTNPNLQNIPIRTALGREIRAAFIACAGARAAVGGLLADRAAADGAFLRGSAAAERLSHRAGHSHADRVGGLRRRPADDGQGDAQPRQGGELRHRLWHFALWAGGAARHRSERGAALHRDLLRALSGRAAVHRPSLEDDAARAAGADALRARAAHSGYPEPQCQSARICRAHGGEHSAAGHGRGPDQAGDDPHRPEARGTQAADRG